MAASITLWSAVLLAATGGAPPSIDVRGDTVCPSAEEVGAALVGLVSSPSPSGAPDVVDLSRENGSIRVRLSNAAGEVVAEKHLPEAPSCAERARAAAVIVAAWEVRLRAGLQPPVEVPRLAAREALAVPAAQIARPAAPAAPPPPPLEMETGAVIFASLAGGTVAPAAMLEVTVSRRDSRFAAGVGALAVATHATAVGTGTATWRRFGGVLDVRSRSRLAKVVLELHAGLALTALGVTGQSYPVTSGATLFDPGGLAGLRLRFPAGALSPWIGATTAVWPRAHDVYVSGTSSSAQLPAFEVLAGAGISLGPDR